MPRYICIKYGDLNKYSDCKKYQTDGLVACTDCKKCKQTDESLKKLNINENDPIEVKYREAYEYFMQADEDFDWYNDSLRSAQRELDYYRLGFTKEHNAVIALVNRYKGVDKKGE